MKPQIDELRAALAASDADPLVQGVLCALLTQLAERGALTGRDVEIILQLGLDSAAQAGAASGARAPRPSRAGGSSRPDDQLDGEDLVDEVLEQSFPASDPPNFSPGTGSGNE